MNKGTAAAMTTLHAKKSLKHLLFLLLVWSSTVSVAPVVAGGGMNEEEMYETSAAGSSNNVVAVMRNKYVGLPPKGRFIAGAAAGVIGSRLVMGSAVGALKVAGVAFITAEVLHHTGVMDDLPSLSEEQADFLKAVKGRVLRTTESFRVQVRRQLNPKAFQQWVDNDKLGALGLAGGALFGTVM